jgi:predicted TIM-barrel fold metal-dependent hydrolase
LIIDSHAYCFQPGDALAGYSTVEEHLAWLQTAQTGHHQPAFRTRDRVPGSSDILGPETPTDWSSLPDVNFRIDHEKGRVVWTVDGEDFTKHFYPPNLRNLEFTPHSLISEMDYADVDYAFLHTNPMLGRDAAFLAECIRLYPDRIGSMAPVDEWRILSDTDAVIAETQTAIQTHGLQAVKFNTRAVFGADPRPWDDGAYRPFWEATVELNVPIFFTLGCGPGSAAGASTGSQFQNGYIGEQRILIDWMNRYPDAVCSVTHGFPWRVFVEDDRIDLPDDVWIPFDNPNLSLEVCFPVRIGDLFEFPYHEVHATLESMAHHIGSDRLLWGTDMPFQNRFCTYRQSRQWIEKYCSFLTDEDLANVMGNTCARVLGLQG